MHKFIDHASNAVKTIAEMTEFVYKVSSPYQ